MLLWGFWALAALVAPGPPASHLALGLAVVAAALLVVLAAAGLPLVARPVPAVSGAAVRRARGLRLPRLMDPDAAGRPRPRAPTARPAA